MTDTETTEASTTIFPTSEENEDVLVEIEGQKGLVVKWVRGSSLYQIVWEGGGNTPPQLKGFYTNITLAKHAIERYLEWRNATLK